MCVVGATNEVPADESLQAFYDRFLLRVPVAPVSDAAFAQRLADWVQRELLRAEPVTGPTALDGELTLRGISQPLRLVATRFACRQDARLQREVCGGDFEAELRRSDFGIDYGLPFVGNAVTVRVQVEGIRQP